ncbi:hypothetical protein DFJ73DRAFT_756192 [Zopfochytrium polystomum]|nr:hypothetical protein DFJ73DRAFT_756192 [Zopfochytrium polystomum]
MAGVTSDLFGLLQMFGGRQQPGPAAGTEAAPPLPSPPWQIRTSSCVTETSREAMGPAAAPARAPPPTTAVLQAHLSPQPRAAPGPSTAVQASGPAPAAQNPPQLVGANWVPSESLPPQRQPPAFVQADAVRTDLVLMAVALKEMQGRLERLEAAVSRSNKRKRNEEKHEATVEKRQRRAEARERKVDGRLTNLRHHVRWTLLTAFGGAVAGLGAAALLSFT